MGALPPLTRSPGRPAALVDCDHRGTAVFRGGEVRCSACYRVCRFYPQAIWHHPRHRIGEAEIRNLRHGGTV